MIAGAIDRQAGSQLLLVARSALVLFVEQHQTYCLGAKEATKGLRQVASSFVTLTNQGSLRGCIGTVYGRLPLIEDVVRNTIAATHDPRFEPVQRAELSDIKIEISVLHSIQGLDYVDYDDLLAHLQPGLDGVIVAWQEQQALLLPQVWERLPEPEHFLQALCHKAQIPWQLFSACPPQINVATFAVNSFTEATMGSASSPATA